MTLLNAYLMAPLPSVAVALDSKKLAAEVAVIEEAVAPQGTGMAATSPSRFPVVLQVLLGCYSIVATSVGWCLLRLAHDT